MLKIYLLFFLLLIICLINIFDNYLCFILDNIIFIYNFSFYLLILTSEHIIIFLNIPNETLSVSTTASEFIEFLSWFGFVVVYLRIAPDSQIVTYFLFVLTIDPCNDYVRMVFEVFIKCFVVLVHSLTPGAPRGVELNYYMFLTSNHFSVVFISHFERFTFAPPTTFTI